MITVDTDSLVSQKSHDLLTRSMNFAWAACASIWARVFVLASPGWKRWPEVFETAQNALSLAMLRSAGGTISPPEFLIAKLEGFSIEDDGSAEWQFVFDLIVMLSAVLDGQDMAVCLETSIRAYLEGMLNVISNNYAVAAGGVISNDVAMERLAADPEWRRVVGFIESL